MQNIKYNIFIFSNIQVLFKFFLTLWIIFIPMKTAFYVAGYVGMILIFLYYIFKHKKHNILLGIFKQYKKTIFIFFLIILSMTISNTISSYTSSISWRTELNYIFRYFLIFLILIFFYKESFFTKRFLLIVILFSLGIQAIDALFQGYYHYDPIKHHFGTFATGLSGAVFYRNPFGMFMATGSSLTFGFLFDSEKYHLNKTQILTLAILFILFITDLLFSYSRASWLFLVTFMIVFFIANYKKVKFIHILLFLATIIIVISIFYYNTNLYHRLMQLLHGNSSHRFEIWANALSLIKNNIIFGHGLMTAWALNLKPDPSVHNSILEILLFLGLLGFFIYSILLWHIFKTCLKNNSNIQIALFFAFLVITQFDDSIIKSIVTLSSLTIFAFFIFTEKVCIDGKSQ